MDENRPGFHLKAPGASGSGGSMRLPGRGSFPGLDDRLVEPEATRDEMVGGRRVVASPALGPHATRHTRLDYLVLAHIVAGFEAATDQLTRHDEKSDFATDTCVYRSGIDPATGERYLEELAFEVVSEQGLGLVTEKARRMQRRGVRRIFAVFVKGPRQVCEWSAGKDCWLELEPGARIEDPCLVKPLAVAALLDAAAADNAVAEALLAKGNPVLRQREEAVRRQAEETGRAAGAARTLLRILASRGLELSEAERRKIQRCRDLDRLDRWVDLALTAVSTSEVLGGS
jgi:hypothetical protein